MEVVSCESQIGGGSLPLERISSMAVAIRPEKIRVPELEERMHRLSIPIIPRTIHDAVMLDIRTIENDDFKLIAAGLQELMDVES